jgi:hypothetical protein
MLPVPMIAIFMPGLLQVDGQDEKPPATAGYSGRSGDAHPAVI